MVNIKKLKEELNKVNSIEEYEGACVYNGNLVDYVGYEEETFPISIKKEANMYVLTDIGRTLTNLQEKDITIEDDDVRTYIEKVLSTLQVGLNKNKELFVFAVNEQSCAYAIGRLYQAIILINYIELQYEEE